ncbi:hypothetical protein [Streptomyces nojiriensis]|uniref:hypothetical protein n=1 Tax=Streptomyces nojiriensis TaxID=66374 RepID=UPI00365458AB
MAKKTIDVTLTSITNDGMRSVSPYGYIGAYSVRQADDEHVYESGILYDVDAGQPIHEGVLKLKPGESLTYNSTKRLSISHFGFSDGQNQMLLMESELRQHTIVTGGSNETFYFGGRKKVLFGELEAFSNFSMGYRAQYEDNDFEFTANFTVTIISSSG